MTKPMIKTDAQYRIRKCQGPFLAKRLLINIIAHLFTNDVVEMAYVHINVNSRNATVEFPRELPNTDPMVSSGTSTNEARHNILGQSIDMVIHNIKAPAKIPNTCIAD